MAISGTLRKPITGDELLMMGDIGRCELVEGEVAQMSPAGGRHGEIASWIATLLTIYIKAEKAGKVYGAETGFYTRRNPDTVRAPDAMFLSSERVAQIEDPVKYLNVPPDLAVEVLSPDDTWTEVEAKVEEYIQAGVRLIWVLDPGRCVVAVYRPSGARALLRQGDQLTGDDVLPGFSAPVARIFE